MSKQLETLLRQTTLVNEAQLKRARERAAQAGGGSLLEVLIREEQIPETAIADLFVARLKLARVRVAATVLDPEAMKKVPERLARKHKCLPMAIEGRVLTLAMIDPTDYQAVQDVEFASAMSVRPVVATRSEILDGIEERYAAEDRIGSFLANVPDVPEISITTDDPQDVSADVQSGLSASEVAPVVKMVNLVIHDAIRSSASDVHIEPALHDMQVRMRVDGVLRDYTRVPKWLHGPLVSRLKILAKLDIAERRLPQDGRVNVHYQGKSIDLRISTLPTHFGEKIVLRVLGGVSAPNITRLGLAPDQQAALESAIAQPQGMILVTGPTGSGKSTTLYALLAKHHRPEINIITVEDPIEYQLAGINQVQINTKAGLTFASVLRSILRQDPDVILVGEMRDKETSEIAFQAAMTGHMVLSTLHTNSAVAAVARLFDLGVDPSIIANSLSMVIAQRLVRRICDECREEYEPEAQVLARSGLGADHEKVYRGAGCPSCGNTGYSGRVGIYEIFRPTNTIRRLINDKASEAEIRNAARQAGMVLLREDALLKIKAGLTSPDEVLRVVQVDETEVPCPNCDAIIEADFAACPYCAHSLKSSCASCGQSLKGDWKVCPYCNSVVVAPPPPPPSPSEPPASARQAPPPPPEPPAPAEPAPERREPREVTGDGTWAWVRTIDPDDLTPAPVVGPKKTKTVVTPETAHTRELERTFDPEILVSPEPFELPAAPAPPPPPSEPPASARQAPPPPSEPPASARQAPPEPVAPPEPEPPTPVTPPAPAAPVQDVREEPAVAAPIPEPPAQPPATDAAAPEPDLLNRRPMRILVVDDDADIRMIVSATLRKLPVPVQIEVAEDGVIAVEKATANPPDMVVLDVMMPRMDGFGVCRALRENLRTAFVPVLMLTASADQSSRTQGYLVGTDDYMSKPFLPIDLNMRVTRLLRRTYGI